MMKSGLSADTLHKIYELIFRGSVLKYTDRAKWGFSEVFAEHVLTDLVSTYGCLLVGTPEFIFSRDYLPVGPDGKSFATDHAGVAILKAIFSTDTADLYYGWLVDKQHPLRVDVVRKGPGRIVTDRGYVYVLRTRHEFILDPPVSNWSWSSQSVMNEIGGCIEVIPNDFNYPVCGPMNLHRESFS